MNRMGVALGLALLATPAAARDYAGDAEALVRSGDMRGAQIQYRNAVRDQPGDAALDYRLAQIDLWLADGPGAEKEAQAALDKGYDPVAATRLLARVYLAENRPGDLLTALPEVPGAPPAKAAAVLAARALGQLTLARPAEAEASAQKARALDPKAVEPVLALLQVAAVQNDAAKVEALLQQAQALAPKDPEVLRDLALADLRRGDEAGALAKYGDAVAAAPGDVALRLSRAQLLLAMNREADAKADLNAALAIQPNSVAGVFMRAKIEARNAQWQAADADMSRLSSLRGQIPGAYLLDAVVKSQLGQKEQALDSAEKFNARSPDNVEGAKLLAAMELEGGRANEALGVLRVVATPTQTDPAVFDLLGRADAASGAWPEAEQAWTRAATLAPGDGPLQTRLGEVRLRLGDPAGALAALDAAAKAKVQPAELPMLRATAALAAGQPDKAEALLASMPASVPKDQLAVLRGALAVARGDLTAAAEAFATVPGTAGGELGLARVALLRGDAAGSEQRLRALLDKQPTNGEALQALSTQLASTGQGAQIIPLLEKAHAAAPKRVDLLLMLARAQLAAGQPDKAGAVLATADAKGADGKAVRSLAATAAAAAGDLSASDMFRNVVAESPHDASAWTGLAAVLTKRGDLAAAKQAAADALKANPGNPALLRTDVAVALKAGGMPAALAEAARLQADPAQRPAADLLTGELYANDQQYDQAAKAFGQVYATAPSGPLAIRVADAQAAAKRPDDAAATLRTYLAAHPDDTAVMVRLGMLDISAGRLKEAEAELTRAHAALPNDAVVLNDLAWLYQKRGAPEAVDMARRAFQLLPNAETADTLGWILAASATPGAGVPYLRMAAQQRPKDPEIAYHLAAALQRAGQTDEAVAVLTPVVQSGVVFGDRAEAARLLANWAKRG